MSGAKDMPDAIHFRHVMGHFATGVTVVTSRGPEGEPCGLTVNAFASVSLEPLLVMVCLHRQSVTHGHILDDGTFAVCVLPAEAREMALRFSEWDHVHRFEELQVRREVTGSPVLDDALAWLDCTVYDIHEAGDHSIVVGEVLACDAREGRPLIFYRGRYHRLDP